MNTWGITGSQFLVVYGGILTLGGLVVLAIRRRVSGESDRSGLAGLLAPELTPYEAALLKGGGSRVLTVAACRLKEAGSVGLGRSGGLEVTGPLPAQPAPVERWVYSLVQRSPGAKTVLDEDAAEPALLPIRQRLWALGLLLERRQRSVIRWQLCWFAPIFGLGIARLIAGVQNHRPVGFLVVLMLVGVVVAYDITKPPISTLAGSRLLKRLAASASTFSSYGYAGDVALSGVETLWAADAALAMALGLKQASSGTGGGGGCGGGGCGGGCGG